jgi:hypothetical protein
MLMGKLLQQFVIESSLPEWGEREREQMYFLSIKRTEQVMLDAILPSWYYGLPGETIVKENQVTAL